MESSGVFVNVSADGIGRELNEFNDYLPGIGMSLLSPKP